MSNPTLLLMLGNFRTTVELDLAKNLNKTHKYVLCNLTIQNKRIGIGLVQGYASIR